MTTRSAAAAGNAVKPDRAGMSGFMAWLGGGHSVVLRQLYPHAATRFSAMAGVLVTTASLAALSMDYALRSGLQVPPWPAAMLAVLWGVAILNIDRMLVVSVDAARTKTQAILMALPRLAMALVFSLVIATPLTLRIFSTAIDAQIYQTQLARSEQQGKAIGRTAEATQAASLQKQIQQDQAVLDGHLPATVTNPALSDAQQQVTSLTAKQQQAQTARDQAYEAYECELYGAGSTCHNASSRPGAGPLAQAKKMEYQQAEDTYEADTKQLQQAQQALQAQQAKLASAQDQSLASAQQQARSELPGLTARYKSLESYVQADASRGTAVNSADTGILAQLQALSSLSRQNFTVFIAQLAVTTLLCLIEMLPVIIKLLLKLNLRDGVYERMERGLDDELLERWERKRAIKRSIAEDEDKTRLAAEQYRLSRQEKLMNDLCDDMAERLGTIGREQVRRYADTVQADLASVRADSDLRVSPAIRLDGAGDAVRDAGDAVRDANEAALPAPPPEAARDAGTPDRNGGSPPHLAGLRGTDLGQGSPQPVIYEFRPEHPLPDLPDAVMLSPSSSAINGTPYRGDRRYP